MRSRFDFWGFVREPPEDSGKLESVRDKWRKPSALSVSQLPGKYSQSSAAHKGQEHMRDGERRKVTFICDSSPRNGDMTHAQKPIDEANDRRGKIKRVRILGSLLGCFTGSDQGPPVAAHSPSHAGITHLDQTPDLSELRIALALEFPMRVSVHRPVLPVVPEGCVARRHGERRSG